MTRWPVAVVLADRVAQERGPMVRQFSARRRVPSNPEGDKEAPRVSDESFEHYKTQQRLHGDQV